MHRGNTSSTLLILLTLLILFLFAATVGAQTAGTGTTADNAQKVAVDPVTKKLRAPTPEESRDLSKGTTFKRVPQNIQIMPAPGGGRMAQLPEEYMDATTVTVDKDGKLQMQCVHGLKEAAALVEGSAPKTAVDSTSQAKSTDKVTSKPATAREEK